MKTQMCLDTHPKCQNHTSLKVDIMDIYATSILDPDIEKGKLEMPKSDGEAVGNSKTEDSLTVNSISAYYSPNFTKFTCQFYIICGIYVSYVLFTVSKHILPMQF